MRKEIEKALENAGITYEEIEHGYIISGFDNTNEIDNVLDYLTKSKINGKVIERRRRDGRDWVITDTNANYYTIEDYQRIIGNDNNFVIAGDNLEGYIEELFESKTTLQRRLYCYEIRDIIEELESLLLSVEEFGSNDVVVIEDNAIIRSFELNKAYINHDTRKFELAIYIEVEND